MQAVYSSSTCAPTNQRPALTDGDPEPKERQLQLQLITPSALAQNQSLLHEIVELINVTFGKDKLFDLKRRFERDDEMIEMLGDHGVCAIVFRPPPALPHYPSSPTGAGVSCNSNGSSRLVATAAVKRWRPEVGGCVDLEMKKLRLEDYELMESGWSFELTAVATLDEEGFRGRGLVGLCMQSLEESLFAQQEGHDEYKSGNGPGATIMLWIHIVEHLNGAYWRRRGFEQVGPSERKPRGVWGSREGFWLTTLVKRIDR